MKFFLVFVLLLSASVKLLQPDHFRSEVFFKFNGIQLRINAYVVIFFKRVDIGLWLDLFSKRSAAS